jgi:phosphatidylglycerophosphatase A
MKKFFTEIIVTCCYVGKIRFAPGTFGSLLAFPLIIFLGYILAATNYVLPLKNYSLTESVILTFFSFTLIVTVILFFIGVYCSNQYIADHTSQDPKEVVIDELVGQMLTIILCIFSSIFLLNSNINAKINSSFLNIFVTLIMPFILFRIFDIFKPWPINYIDSNIKGGLGIMLDDIIAAIFATVMNYAIIFMIISYTG